MGTLEEEEEKRRKGEKEIEDRRQKTEDAQSKIQNLKSKVESPSTPKWPRLVFALLIIGLIAGLPPLLTWQRTGEQRARSLSNMRRLADAWQLYAQDWDGAPVPVVEWRTDAAETADAGTADTGKHKGANGYWLTWNMRLGAYGAMTAILDNPANPAGERRQELHDPARGCPAVTGYALNTRFWDTFAPGPFPVDNLELPAQTALFVEAGPMSASPMRPPQSESESRHWARLEYSDVADRIEGLWPYPSTHGGKLAVVAADGHAASLSVEHYAPASGPHNALYGRIGSDIYNWNGGHANGDVDHPPVE